MADDFIMANNGFVELLKDLKNPGNTTKSGKDAVLLGVNSGRCPKFRRDAGRRCEVARGSILQQRVF